jgi:hypothetical protein
MTIQKHYEVEVDSIPDCNLCNDHQLAVYDCKTKQGPWGNLCEKHFSIFGVGLGLGKGRKLIIKGKS